jgi:hypothetical protein
VRTSALERDLLDLIMSQRDPFQRPMSFAEQGRRDATPPTGQKGVTHPTVAQVVLPPIDPWWCFVFELGIIR